MKSAKNQKIKVETILRGRIKKISKLIPPRISLIVILFISTMELFPGGVSAVTIPPGFYIVAQDEGVACYRKDYGSGDPDFVMVIDLDRARFGTITGDIINPGVGSGPLGGNMPLIKRLSLEELWNRANGANNKTFAVFNGQFFSYELDNNAYLAFSLHADYQHISDGYAILTEYPGQKSLLQTDQVAASATTQSFDAGVFQAPNGPDHRIAGLTTDADKGPSNYTGRTFIGVHDSNGDGRNETVLVFVSAYASQISAAGVLSDFGAVGQIMFDGGGSSQLIVNGSGYVNSSRAIPHAFMVIADTPPAPPSYTCEYIAQGYPGQEWGWQTFPVNSRQTFVVIFKNVGSTTWKNSGGTGGAGYVELESVTSGGVLANSYIYPDDGYGWLNRQRVETFD